MDDEVDESELVEPGSIYENELLHSNGFDRLLSLDIAAGDSPNLAAIETGRVYNALPENCIRLLTIAPGDVESEVCCQVRHYALDEQTRYSALSYTWGAGPAEHAIALNGNRIHVRKNLWRFLLQARSSGSQMMGLLWIDALCIDQSNLDERAQQVQCMPAIYSMAIKVFIWLGPSYQNSDAAMIALAKPLSNWLAKGRLLRVWSKPLGTAIYRLCHRSYWTRLWIFQELSMAKQIDIICGNKVVSFEALCNLLSLLKSEDLPVRQHERLEYSAPANSPASSITHQISQEPRHSSLWNLLTATQHLRCSDDRDKVYALLGIAEGGGTGIVVDYNVSLTALMNAVLRNEHSLRFPKSVYDAETQCSHLTELFGVEKRMLFECSGPHGRCPPPQQDKRGLPSALYFNREISVWWAAFHGHKSILRLLQNDKDRDPTYYRNEAIATGLHAATEMMLSVEQFKPNMASWQGQTALHTAAVWGVEEVASFCLLDDAVNVQARDNTGSTALDIAAGRGHQSIVRLLLDPSHLPVSGVPEYLGQALVSAVEAWESGHDTATVANLLIDTGLIDSRNADAAMLIAEQMNITGLEEYWWNSVKGNETLLQGFESDAHWRQARG